MAIRILHTAQRDSNRSALFLASISFARHLQMQIFSDVSAVFLRLRMRHYYLQDGAKTAIENAIARKTGVYKKVGINLPSLLEEVDFDFFNRCYRTVWHFLE